MKAEDNPFPYITLVEGTTPAAPAAGQQREFIDSADHKVKRVNSSGSVTTVEGGGGGGSSIKDRRWTAAATSTSIDEFNDSSLDASWVRVDGTNAPAANVTWTEDADVLSANYTTGTDTGNAQHALLRPLSGAGGAMSTGDAFVSCITLLAPWATNYSIAGIALADGVTYGSGLQLFGELGQAATMINNLRKNSSFTTDGGGTTEAILAITQPIFVRLAYLGSSNWRFDRSPDGVSWIKGTSLNYPSFTPTHVGLNIRQPGTTNRFAASFEFLRRQSGVS